MLALLTAASALWLSAGQNTSGSGNAKAPAVRALSKARHYAIAYLASTNAEAGGSAKPPASILQSIGDGLAKRLSKQGLVRVPALDVQCCTIQFTLVSGGGTEDASRGIRQSRQAPLVVRAVLMDIDAQQIYSKEFRSEAKTTDSAVESLIDSLLADDKLLNKLKGG